MIIPVASEDEFVSLTLEMFPEINDIFRYGAGIYRLYYKNISMNFAMLRMCVVCLQCILTSLKNQGRTLGTLSDSLMSANGLQILSLRTSLVPL